MRPGSLLAERHHQHQDAAGEPAAVAASVSPVGEEGEPFGACGADPAVVRVLALQVIQEVSASAAVHVSAGPAADGLVEEVTECQAGGCSPALVCGCLQRLGGQRPSPLRHPPAQGRFPSRFRSPRHLLLLVLGLAALRAQPAAPIARDECTHPADRSEREHPSEWTQDPLFASGPLTRSASFSENVRLLDGMGCRACFLMLPCGSPGAGTGGAFGVGKGPFKAPFLSAKVPPSAFPLMA